MSRVIAITGAGGFIGSYLDKFLQQNGFTVIRLVRKPDGPGDRMFDLRSPSFDSSLLKDVEVLIHCAFMREDGTNEAEHINLKAAEDLKRAALSAGVKKIIFFSSLSAHEDARSSYGKSKLAIEQIFSTPDDVILKCGLVIGAGGLFNEMMNFALKKKIVPLVDGGQQPVQFIAINDVATAIHFILTEQLAGQFLLAYPQSVSYRNLFQAIGDYFNVPLKFIVVPSWLIRAFLSLGFLMRLRLPVSKENLHGLQSMREWNSDDSMKKLQLNNRSINEALQITFPK
jgi:nucleoside-diphosphate-sugar epimerase